MHRHRPCRPRPSLSDRRPPASCSAVPRAEANALLGGKAAATDRLVGCGFDVPPSAAVTTSAYRVVATDPAVVALLDRLGVVCDDDEVGADEIDEVFLGAELPPALEEEVLRTDSPAEGRPVATA